ncbi:MAG TPA: M12 family metallo-peptidase [Planctomycetota bacterium]
MKPLRILLTVTVLVSPITALPQRAKERATPRLVRQAEGPAGAVTVAFDSATFRGLAERHARGLPFVLDEVPVPGGGSLGLELRPVGVMAEGASAVVVDPDGSERRLAPRVRCFAGTVVGGGTAFLGIGDDLLHGYFHDQGQLYLVSSGGSPRGRATIVRADDLGEFDGGLCGLGEKVLADGTGSDVQRALATPALRTADVFIEADNDFRARFTSNQACIDYVALLLTAASEIYRRDIGSRFNVPDGYLRVWNTTPPWGPITGFRSLSNVYDWWLSTANPLRNIPRAAVHVMTSPVFGGTSRGVGGLCVAKRAFEISSLTGSFPYPVEHSSRYNWDLFVVCHEFGHTFGSPHSELYNPPIECADGSGPDSGTIMSYCHTKYGMARVGLRFHLREQQTIRNSLPNATCLRTEILAPGDYDGNGLADEGDLVALRGVLGQGFRSLASEEVFDLDGSGKLDDADHDRLAWLVFDSPPAQTFVRNGQGLNPNCLEPLASPLLGTTWRASILAPGVGSSTLLVGYDEPLDGQLTTRGELLVKTQPFGGTKLFNSTAFSDGTQALHEIPLPLDPLLFGRAVSFQALIIDGPAGNQYCNAVDVILSPWE